MSIGDRSWRRASVILASIEPVNGGFPLADQIIPTLV